MTRQTVTEIMNRFLEFINTADKNLAAEIIEENASFHVPGRREPLKGPSGYLEIIAMMRSGFSDVQWKFGELIIDGNNVAARFSMKATHDGLFFGVPATGNAIEIRAINIYHLTGQKIIEEFGVPDLVGLLGQIGALPSQPEG